MEKITAFHLLLLPHHRKNLMEKHAVSGNFSYQKSAKGTAIAAIEANNHIYCLQINNRKVPAGKGNQFNLNETVPSRYGH